ncbi:Premnaspirodiene oxygenase [Zea mays]|uniref:Cytochrome P450 71D7 n=1 Tax=Zea mays TaxID=4577 RepID=A0A1D6KEM8_MAIZE|nr:Premnaspirodiene oxygenase [Zea mays]ONM01600.1 Cytochrome P450 71D7 [Zea mays]
MDNSAYYCYCCLLALLPPLYFLVKFWWRTSCARRSHGLRLPPGPWQLPIIGSIHHLRGSLVHRALRDLSLRHGPLMFLRLGEVPVVVASTPDAAKEFMKTHDATFATRPMTLSAKVFAKDGPGIVVAPYGGDHWRQLRKICIVELLSARRVRSFGPVREEEAARLVQAVAGASTRRAPAPAPLVDLGRLAAVYVADASVRAIVGRRFGETDALLRFVDESVSLAGGFTPVDLFPSSLLVRVLTLRRTVRRLEHFRESLFGFMDGVVREHLERKQSSRGGGGGEEEEEADMVDVLLRIQQEGNLKFPLTMRIIEAVIFDLIAGGIETASSTLQWAMAELMRNPAAMSKAQAEVRGVYAGQTKVTEDRLGELPYLQLVIKETLRLHVPGPLLIPRECQEHCRVLGYDVPKGAMVLVNAWAIARSPEYWEEPDAFDPDRFAGDAARDFRGNDFEFIPFGAGRRICPGMAFGLANIELGLASLLFHFDWSLPEGVVPSEMDMAETMGITARRKADLLLSATPRVVPRPS